MELYGFAIDVGCVKTIAYTYILNGKFYTHLTAFFFQIINNSFWHTLITNFVLLYAKFKGFLLRIRIIKAIPTQ